MHTYTDDEVLFLKENVSGRSYAELTELFNEHFGLNFTLSQIKGALARNNLCNGRDARFKQGGVPFNKGMKGVYQGGKETQFKKGSKPHNYKPVGSERINVDGYTEVKVADQRKWRHKHCVVWEEVNGPIPKGCAVLFADGDKSNLSIDNLILVSRGKLAVMNKKGLIQPDAELTKTGTVIADVYMKISERKRKAKKRKKT